MNNKFIKNMSWIFFGNIAHAILQYLINIICARHFGASDYGLINYTSSLIAFFLTIGTLGFNGIITKKLAEDEKNTGKYLGTSFLSRIIFSVFAIILIQMILLYSGESDNVLLMVVFCQSLQILFCSSDLVVYWYRYKSNSKLVEIVRLFSFFVSAICKVLAILYYDSIVLYTLGVSLESLIFGVLLTIVYLRDYQDYKLEFSFEIFKKLIKLSYPFVCSSLLITIYAQTDKIMLRNMLSDVSVGLYSVSLTLAGAISIIPSALIEGFRPDIMNFKNYNPKLYIKRLQQLYGIVFWICILYCIFITLFANPIVNLLYGNDYLGAVPSLGLIVWYTSFSYFGAINAMYMVAENKIKWVQVNTFIGAVCNVVLNLILIPNFGIVGAAGASLLTQIIANFILMGVIKDLRNGFYIMLQGIILKGFINQK